MYQKIKKFIRSKKAAGSIETSIKVVTAVILGALILIGTYGVVNEVVLPATNSKVTSLFAYSSEGGSDAGGGGSNTPTSTVLEAGKTVPTGCKYTCSGGTTYNAGETIPTEYTPQTGDTFDDGEYEYKFNKTFVTPMGEWMDAGSNWGVSVKSPSKSTFAQMYSSINGAPVTNLQYLFYQNTSITVAPVLSINTTDMTSAFFGCNNLASAPIIPDSVTEMSQVFAHCSSLTLAPVIPNGVKNISNAFEDSGLLVAPIIPASVTDISYAFDGCTSLSGTIEINTVISERTKYQFCLRGTQITAVTGTGSNWPVIELS